MSVDGSSLGWSTEQNNGMAIVTRQTMERQTATIVCLAFQMRLRPSPCLLEDATALQLQRRSKARCPIAAVRWTEGCCSLQGCPLLRSSNQRRSMNDVVGH